MTELVKETMRLSNTLDTLQFLRTAKNASDKEIHSTLDKAYAEASLNGVKEMLYRLMFHIGDISRKHNIFKEFDITSETGGAQERKTFRSCVRWMQKNTPDFLHNNLKLIVEFTSYETLMYYQVTTNRYLGNVMGIEKLFIDNQYLFPFLKSEIVSGVNLNLIARHLPKLTTGKQRTTKKTLVGKRGKTEFTWTLPKGKSWVKINGQIVTGDKITVKSGDVAEYPREKKSETLTRQTFINKWIKDFCGFMNWTITDYKQFKSKQNTAEQKMSSLSVMNMNEDEFSVFLDSLTSGQRKRVVKSLTNSKWGNLSTWYKAWEDEQSDLAQRIRKSTTPAEKNALMKEFKVKTTGEQTVDLLAQLIGGSLNTQQVNNNYQSMIERMNIKHSVFPIIDGSGSMNSCLSHNGVRISNRQVAYAMAIAFTTMNPNPRFRNTYGWFSRNFKIFGRSEYGDTYVSMFKNVDKYVSHTKTFTENYRLLMETDPQEVSSTNMFASVEYFVNLVKLGRCTMEELPETLLYLTDNEYNSGKSPKEAVILANSIGWKPKLIFWGITTMSDNVKEDLKYTPNGLFIGGFNESCLSQILNGINKDSINPEDELWAIYNDIRYSMIKVGE
jgi:hypothetical protein